MSRWLSPGGLAWLLYWEALLRFREFGAGRSRTAVLRVWIALALLAHGVVVLILWMGTRGRVHEAAAYRPVVIALAFVVLLIAVLQGLGLTLRTLFDSRDLALALTAPLPFSRLLSARVLSLVIANAASPAVMLIPIANSAAVLGHWQWLWLYPLTLAVAAIGVGFALLLIRPVLHFAGPQQMRRVLQVLQFSIPMVFVVWNGLNRGHNGAAQMTAPSPVLWLADAVHGAPAQLFVIFVGAIVLLALGRVGIDASVRALLLEPEPPTLWRRAPSSPRAFRSGLLLNMLLKEWRTTLRDSRLMVSLVGQPLMLAVAFMPVLLQIHDRSAGIAALAVYIACQMSQLLCNLNVNAESAPALLGTAPVARARLLHAKLLAALVPVWLLAALVVGVIGVQSLRDAWFAGFGIFGGSLSIGALILARPNPVDRRSFLRPTTRRRTDVIDLLGVLILEAGWAAATYWLCLGYWIAALLMLASLLIPLLQWLRDRRKVELLGY